MRPGCDHDGPASGFDLSLRLRGSRLRTGIRLSILAWFAALWREVYSLRNVAAHAYLDIDLERVWEIVTDHLPPLPTAEEKVLARPSA